MPCGAAEEGPGLELVAPNDLPDLEIKVLTKAIDVACATLYNERALLGEDGGGGGGDPIIRRRDDFDVPQG